MRQKITFFYPHVNLFEITENADPEVIGKLFFTDTSAIWIYQTYLKLKEIDPDIMLSSTLPDSGIIIAFEGDLPVPCETRKERYLISIIADSSPRSFANMRIVQNRAQLRLVKRSTHIPHWPQPGLSHRDRARGTEVKNVVYIGDIANIAPEMLLPSFATEMAKLGVIWTMRLSGDVGVNDYTDVDILVAVRHFTLDGYTRKPASKLQNAWLAGVPAVLGPEIAFQEIGTHGVDYLEARNQRDIVSAVDRLKTDSDFYNSVVSAGLEKAVNLESNIVQQWQSIFETARSEYDAWSRKTNLGVFWARNIVDQKIRGLRHRLLKRQGLDHNAV